ncbi:MAG: GNAT family N-acetyltransferase [Microbacteriaceae bacterium]
MNANIRRAVLSDTERLGALHSACWAELYTGFLPPDVLAELDAETMAHLWTKFVNRGGDYVQYVAEVDGDIVGFVGYGPGRDVGYEDLTELYFMYVDGSFKRRGIGKQLAEAAWSASYAWLWDRNRAAVAFYRKMKFGPDSQRRRGTLFGTELLEIRVTRDIRQPS